jgi:hypothetical protein
MHLEKFPANLDEFHMRNSLLSMLPTFPRGMKCIDCFNSNLRYIPELPHGFEELYCANMKYLTTLPFLPKSLKVLSVYNNPQLKSLPYLPHTLEELYLDNTGISILGNIPESLSVLELTRCNNLIVKKEYADNIREYKKKMDTYFKNGSNTLSLTIKEELLSVALSPDRMRSYFEMGVSISDVI